MSLYKDASLAMIPTAYKDGKLYSVRPTDGSGDFTFSRGTTATRVASSGYIEKGRENVLLNSVWNGIGTNVPPTSWTNGFTSGNYESASSSFGGNNGIRFYGTSARRYVSQIPSFSGIMALSIYVESVTTADEIRYVLNQIGGTELFYLEDSSVVANTTSILAGKTYTLVFNTSGTTEIRIGGGVTGSRTYDFTLSVPQLEQGLVRTDYIETTTTSVSAGILEDMPRLDYSGGASCPALLLEPQRTNKLSNSEYINSGSTWVEENGADCTPNYATSPEGVDNATRVQLDNSGAFSLTRIWSNFSPNASNDTASFYAKSNTGSSFDIVIYFRDAGFGAVRGNKTITITNEWQRFDLTADCSGAAGNVMFLIYNTTASENWDFLMYGAQVEAGNYPTSYIPTYGASVTRSVDVCNGAGDADTFNDSEGVLFVELEALAEDSTYRFISVSDGTSTNRINILLNNNNTLRAFVAGVGSLISSVDITQNNKAAIKYKSGDYAFWVNGTEVATNTSTSGTHTGLDTLSFDMGNGSNDFYGKTKQVLYFPTALTDTELASLTTL